jgi:predicted ATP-grasp superfamily ATP-dependent carboligase
VRALIVGSQHARGALAAVRALAAADWITGVGSPRRAGLAPRSRRTYRWHPVPPPQKDPKAFIKATNAAIVEGGYEVVFGSGDAEILAMSEARRDIRAIFPYAQHEQLAQAIDKSSLAGAANAAGIATPRTIDLIDGAIPETSYPIVIKARLHWTRDNISTARIEAAVAHSEREAVDLVAEVRSLGGEPLLQEAVSGDLLAYTALAGEDSKILIDVQQRADMVWPPEGGVSVRAVSERTDEGLRDKVAALLSGLGWFGLAQLQFIAPSSGEPQLIDLNPRFYGSLALAAAAGPNLPAAWANLATQRPVEVEEARPGVRYQWLFGDILRALVEKRGGVSRDLLGCLSFARGATHSVWSARDPGPALSYARLLSSRALRRFVR